MPSFLRTDRQTKTTGFVFRPFAKSRTRTCGSHDIHAFGRVPVVPVLFRFEQYLIKSIRFAEERIASDSGDMHPFSQNTCPPQSEITDECVYLNFDHGAQQALLCEYVDLGPHPTYVILDSGCTRAMGFRFAIDRLVQACQQHPNRDQFWFPKQPCQSKFSSANGEQSTVKERLVIHFHNDHAHTGWITTCVDILDKGKVPILFSVVQMRNLRIKH